MAEPREPRPGDDPEAARRASGDAMTPGPGGAARPGGVTPAGRLLFWIRAAFVGDAVLAAIGGLLVATGQEAAGVGLLVFTAVRAALGVVALLLASRSLEQRRDEDDRPSVIR